MDLGQVAKRGHRATYQGDASVITNDHVAFPCIHVAPRS